MRTTRMGYIGAPHQELWQRTRNDLRHAWGVLRSVRAELARAGVIPDDVTAPGDWPSVEKEMVDAVRELAGDEALRDVRGRDGGGASDA